MTDILSVFAAGQKILKLANSHDRYEAVPGIRLNILKATTYC
jgi:hypothetical protein